MKELVVISGKGGTGKTSFVASFAALAGQAVLVDCDVDAADLHLVLTPRIVRWEKFVGGSKARIDAGHCTACGKCAPLCRFNAIQRDSAGNGNAGRTFHVDRLACEGCGVCVDHCPERAIEFAPAVAGEWFVSETRFGSLVHAQLGIGAENSGKLVTQLRRAAQHIALQRRLELIICDGSPGIGCPVIASLTGASLALFVVEPTASGLHDFQRVAQLTQRLGVPGAIVVNKADLNPEVSQSLETTASGHDIEALGRVPYDSEVTRAQIASRAVVEVSDGPAARALRQLWQRLQTTLHTVTPSTAGGLVPLQPNSSGREPQLRSALG
jgi:MinD superfamily P-loop ATPase